MKLTPDIRTILRVVQLNAADTVKRIAERTKLSPATVQYQLQRLRDEGIIRRGALINHFRIGLQQWQVYLALRPAAYHRRRELAEHFRSSAQVHWLAELGGEFHFGLSLTASSAAEIAEFLGTTGAPRGEPFYHKTVSQVTSFTTFRTKHLTPEVRSTSADAISISSKVAAHVIEPLDRRILSALADPKFGSHPRMAQALAVPRSTLEYRLKRLEQLKIIERHIYFVDSRRLGFITFRMLISARNVSARVREALSSFALRDPNVVFLVECLGSIDFELAVEVREPLEVTNVLERLHLACGDLLERSTGACTAAIDFG